MSPRTGLVKWITLIAALVVTKSATGNPILCYKCSNMPLPYVCDTITQCGQHEKCYIERYVSTAGVTYFESGCAPDLICSQNDRKRKRTLFPDCTECCNSNYCNKNLCSVRPAKPLRNCLQCNRVFSPTDCTSVAACSEDELCHTQETKQFGFTFYTLGCLSKTACQAVDVFGRKKSLLRRSEKCHHCCNGENCNRQLCNDATTTTTPRHTTSTTPSTPPTTVPSTTSMPHTATHPKPNHFRDCLDIYDANIRQDGIYKIFYNNHVSLQVYCDMVNGGWTVIQRRANGNENFTRGWTDYVNGFGNLFDNFWLGLKYIYQLTSTPMDILIEVYTKDTFQRAMLQYSNFYLDGPSDNYRMHLNNSGVYNTVAQQRGYDHNYGFGYHDGSQFATFDHPDNNTCVLRFGMGGWWYNHCWVVLLNNPYDQMTVNGADGNVTRSEIKLRRA